MKTFRIPMYLVMALLIPIYVCLAEGNLRKLKGKINGGGPKIDLRTSGGSIKILKL